MTYPAAGLIADLLYPPTGDPGYTSLTHTALTDDGYAKPNMLQTIEPTRSTSLRHGWQTLWFRDARYAGGAHVDAGGRTVTGVVTHFLLAPGPNLLLPEFYAKMTALADIEDIRSRLVRVYPDDRDDNPTAEKVMPVGGNARWAGGEPSMTYPKAMPKANPRALRAPEYLVRIEMRVQASSAAPTFILDNRYPKWLNPNELVGQRTLVG